MSAYLFVHFKEKRTPDGEQAYFGVSRDGFVWEEVNEGNPVLWSYYGDKGVRDFTIIRTKDEKFVIMATDLSLSYGMRNQYNHSWAEISRNGSKHLVLWESEDLITWSKQRLVKLGDENFGCLWAPDIIFDEAGGDYIVHWSSSHASDGFDKKAIFYSRTKDFTEFSKPELLYRKEGSDIIDSAMYFEGGKYYLFVKSDRKPEGVILLEGDKATGPFRRIEAFDSTMEDLGSGLYEAPTAVRLDDGRWCLFLDYYGCAAEGQGYVPFISGDISTGIFKRADESFSFPYGFKHGTILKISDGEYERLKQYRKKPSEH